MSESIVASSYIAVMIIGLVHGLELGHGWPVAALLSTTARRSYVYGTAAGAILAVAHLISSLAVVAIYYLAMFFFGAFIDFTANWFKILTASILLILAFRFFRQKEHVHGLHAEHIEMDGREVSHEDAHKHGLSHTHESKHHHFYAENQIMGLKGLAGFAFVLGFAHEEELMLFALFVGGVSPLVGMTIYASAVSVSLITITLVAIKAFATVEARLKKYQKHIPKITGVVLVILSILFLLPVLGGPTIY